MEINYQIPGMLWILTVQIGNRLFIDIYRFPSSKIIDFLYKLEEIVENMGNNNYSCIIGDFNINVDNARPSY